jgi:translation initiation factor 1
MSMVILKDPAMAKLIKKEEPNILWTDDPEQQKKKNKKPSQTPVVPAEYTLKIRLEKNKRGGKSVSVIFELPQNPDFCKKLCKELKSKCGTGGSVKTDTIEIQGDHRPKLKELLEKKGFQVKLAGG